MAPPGNSTKKPPQDKPSPVPDLSADESSDTCPSFESDVDVARPRKKHKRSRRTLPFRGHKLERTSIAQLTGDHLGSNSNPIERNQESLKIAKLSKRAPRHSTHKRSSKYRVTKRKHHSKHRSKDSPTASSSSDSSSEDSDSEPSVQRRSSQKRSRRSHRRSVSPPKRTHRTSTSKAASHPSERKAHGKVHPYSIQPESDNEQATSSGPASARADDHAPASELDSQSLQIGTLSTSSHPAEGTLSERMGTKDNRAKARKICKFSLQQLHANILMLGRI